MESMYRIRQHPRAGALPILHPDAKVAEPSVTDRTLLRNLANLMVEATAARDNPSLKKEWIRHNKLIKGQPMILVYPEDAWFEMLSPDTLQCESEYWQVWEWFLKHAIYKAKKIDDDYVFENELVIEPVISISGWGLEANYSKNSLNGSFVWDAPIKEYSDISFLKKPAVSYDAVETQRRMDIVKDVFDGIIPVVFNGVTRIHHDPVGEATTLRGMQQLMLDLYDEPEWVHQLMRFISEGIEGIYNFYEDNGLLRINNKNHYVGSGGLGYTDELHSDSEEVKLGQMWGFGLGQEFSDVSESQHEEFLLNYQLPLLDRCGLTAYGCCEPYTNKFNMLKKIRNLRRVSVSPWCDINKAAAALGRNYIYSFKPNPALIAMGFNSKEIREYLKRAIDAAKDCNLEIILKDTITVQNEPDRIERFVAIIREETEAIR
jgi:hypothetical protein